MDPTSDPTDLCPACGHRHDDCPECEEPVCPAEGHDLSDVDARGYDKDPGVYCPGCCPLCADGVVA